MQDAKSESLRNFIQELIKEHFAFIATVIGGFWGFLILVFYFQSHPVPSNVFIELSPSDLFLIFGGIIFLFSILAFLSIAPFLMILDNVKPEASTDKNQSAPKYIWNLNRKKKIALIISTIIFYFFLLLIFLYLAIFNSSILVPAWYKYLSEILAVVLLLELLLLPIDKKGIFARAIFAPLVFIILSPNVSDNIVRFSNFGNKSVCLLLSKDNKNIVRMFAHTISTAISDGKYFTATPIHLVFQTKEYLYLQDTDKSRPVFQLSTKDNLLFTPSIREGKDKQREEYCDPI